MHCKGHVTPEGTSRLPFGGLASLSTSNIRRQSVKKHKILKRINPLETLNVIAKSKMSNQC